MDDMSRISRRGLFHGLMAGGVAISVPGLWSMARAQVPLASGRAPDTLVVATEAAVDNLDPATNIDWAMGLVPVYETLTVLKGGSTTEVVPSLAVSWTRNDDASRWTFEIAPGAKFHDGTVCDAAAVKAAILRTLTLGSGNGYVWGIDDGEKQMIVEEGNRLTFDLGAPRACFDVQVSGQYGFWIASPAAAAAHSTGPDDQGSAWLQVNPVGTGPYRLVSLEPGQQAISEADPDYRGGWKPGQFKRIVIRAVPVESSRLQMLESGEADVIFPLPPEETIALKDAGRFAVSEGKTLTMAYVALGCYGPLADPRARQAMNHAFDAVAYRDQIQLGLKDPAQGCFPVGLSGANPDQAVPGFDLAKAQELLTAAGVAPGTELSYLFYEGNGKQAGELLQALLASLGITLTLQEKSYSAFAADYFGDAPPAERHNMYAFSWWPNFNHPNEYARPLFHSGSAGSMGGNAGFYRNEEVDRILDETFNAAIDDALFEKMKRLQEILAIEDPAWIPLFQDRTAMPYRTDVTGMDLNPAYALTLPFYGMSRSEG